MGGGIVAPVRRRGALLLALAAAATALVPPTASAGRPANQVPTSASAGASCEMERSPFAAVAGAALRPSEHVSKDREATRYVLWRGFVPSFDGLPLSVDVTVPCGVEGPRPSVTMLHGFTDDKTVWEETGKSDTVLSPGRPGANTRWNNIWFASRGYATLTYTARGWHDSCGPDAPGTDGKVPSARCADFAYWIHLDDVRWEVRDAQWLTAGLVEGGVADPERLAITGGSYGGAPTAMAALLDDHVMCGADAMPEALGSDPCRGKPNGTMAPWTTPNGEQTLHWAAAVPMYTFADLLEVLAPNGRGSDGWSLAPADASHRDPVGVPLASTIEGLLLAGSLTGVFAPPGRDADSDIKTMTGRLLAGPPYPAGDEVVANGIGVSARFRSPIAIPAQGRVPIFWVQGLTDALFPGDQALQQLAALRRQDPTYPIKVFLGDIGHDYASERQDEWDLVKAEMNDFLDHHLRPDRTPEPPTFDVRATITRCLDPDAPMRAVVAPTWAALHPGHITLSSERQRRTSTADQGPAGIATDPISTATIGGPESYKGCRIMRPSVADPTVATYEFPVERELLMVGGPVVEVRFDSPGLDLPLSVRVWDVAADRSEQALVTRGTFRTDDAAGLGRVARFQLTPNGYRFAAGHTLKVEVTGNDGPYLLAKDEHVAIAVRGVDLTLPLHERTRSTERPAGTNDRDDGNGGDVAELVWGAVAVSLTAFVGYGLWRRRRRA